MSGAKRHSHKTPCLGMNGIMMTRAGTVSYTHLYLHPAVTYVYVSSLGCKYSFLGLQAFSSLCQSVDFVNILTARLRDGDGPLFMRVSAWPRAGL